MFANVPARYRIRIGQKFEMSTDKTIEPSGRGLMARLGRCFRRFRPQPRRRHRHRVHPAGDPFLHAGLCNSRKLHLVCGPGNHDERHRRRRPPAAHRPVAAANVNEISLKTGDLRQHGDHGRQGMPRPDRRPARIRDFCRCRRGQDKVHRPDKEIDKTGFDVKPGGALTKNMLRVFYPWPVMTDFMSKLMSNLKGGKTLHFATRHLAERTVRRLTDSDARNRGKRGKARQCLNMRGRMAGWRSVGRGSPEPRPTGEGSRRSSSHSWCRCCCACIS